MKTATMMTSKSFVRKPAPKSEWGLSVVREAVVAGTLSGAMVALWYLLCDTIGGRPFHTPALLGTIFFDGLHGHDIGSATLVSVLKFTALHFAAFTAFGLATALVIAAAEREPLLILGALMVYACYEVCFLAFVTVLDASALGSIGWWKIAAANAITLGAVWGYFQYQHPQLLRRFADRWADLGAEPAGSQLLVAEPIAPSSPASGGGA